MPCMPRMPCVPFPAMPCPHCCVKCQSKNNRQHATRTPLLYIEYLCCRVKQYTYLTAPSEHPLPRQNSLLLNSKSGSSPTPLTPPNNQTRHDDDDKYSAQCTRLEKKYFKSKTGPKICYLHLHPGVGTMYTPNPALSETYIRVLC